MVGDYVHATQPAGCASTILRSIPPTEVGGSFKHGLQRTSPNCSGNSTHGSGWIGPGTAHEGCKAAAWINRTRGKAGRGQSTHFRGWDSRRYVTNSFCRRRLKHPPTAVGGIAQKGDTQPKKRRSRNLPV